VLAVRTAAELKDACDREFPGCDVLLMAAAVADFAPIAEQGKIKKGGRDHLDLVLAPTADVISGLAARRNPNQTIVGFAAEHGVEGLEHARGKLAAKHLDAVVYNDISRDDIGFDTNENEVTILTTANGRPAVERHVAKAPKESVASAILDAVGELRDAH
jgi:phosphopantothenoylcysteine decarboxylase/phosphopantothenate--cysteine ligase